MNITTKDPADLSIHPAAKRMPEWLKDDPRFEALVRDVRDRGIDRPLLIDKEDRVVVGAMYLAAAKRLGLASVGCVVIEQEEIPAAMLADLIHRQHFTKSAIAYLAYPLLKPAHEIARAKKLKKLEKSQQLPVVGSSDYLGKVEDFAEINGIERSLFFLAAFVHDKFENRKKWLWNDSPVELTFEEYYEPKILQVPMGGEHEDNLPLGLGAVKAGIGAKLSGKLHDQSPSTGHKLLLDGLKAMKNRFKHWDFLTTSEKNAVRAAISETVGEMPQDLRAEFKSALKAANKHNLEEAA